MRNVKKQDEALSLCSFATSGVNVSVFPGAKL